MLATAETTIVPIITAFIAAAGTVLAARAANNSKKVSREVATGNGKTLGVTVYDLQDQIERGLQNLSRRIGRRITEHERRDDELLKPLYEAQGIEWPEDEE